MCIILLCLISNQILLWKIQERCLIYCRKRKTKGISLTNHKRHKQRNEPIRIRNNSMWQTPSARKCARGKLRLVLVLLVIGRESGVLSTNHRGKHSKRKLKLLSPTLNWKSLDCVFMPPLSVLSTLSLKAKNWLNCEINDNSAIIPNHNVNTYHDLIFELLQGWLRNTESSKGMELLSSTKD